MSGPFDIPDLPPAVALHRGGIPGRIPHDLVALAWIDRRPRRRRLVTVHDEGFFVDLPEATALEQGDCFELADGRLIEVVAAEEPLVQVTGDLPRLAWHLGSRHVPCQTEPRRLLLRPDPGLEALLEALGATLARVSEPFAPEPGPAHHHEPPAAPGPVAHRLPARGPFDPG